MIFHPKALSVIFFSFESDVDSSCAMIDNNGLMFLIVMVMMHLFHLEVTNMEEEGVRF